MSGDLVKRPVPVLTHRAGRGRSGANLPQGGDTCQLLVTSTLRAVHHLAGAAEACELLGVSRQRLHVLARREDFPAPVAVLAMGSVWERQALEDWAQRTGRVRKDEA